MDRLEEILKELRGFVAEREGAGPRPEESGDGDQGDVVVFSKRFLRARNSKMTITDRIEVNPKVMLGKPVIRGTRITVELILRKLGGGTSKKDLLDAYPSLTREDIQAEATPTVQPGRIRIGQSPGG